MMDNADKFPADIAAAMKAGENGAKGARMMMNEELIFGSNGYAYHMQRCDVPAGVDTVGIFGANCDVCLNLAEQPVKVYAQSLVGNEARELTEGVAGGTVTVTKELVRGIFGGTDKSAPALMLRFCLA